MSLDSFDTVAPSPAPDKTLSVLREAIGDRCVPAIRRVIVSADGLSPDEGLALLGAYVAIADPVSRQAILDAVITIAAVPIGRSSGRRVTR